MKDPRDIEERLAEGRKDYQKIPVPEEARARVETGIMRAKAEKEEQIGKGTERGHEKPEKQEAGGKKNMKTNQKKIIKFRIEAAVAAAAAVIDILPNTGAGAAHAMGSIPVVGKLFQAVTFRDYRYESNRFDADVEVPQIVVDDMAEEEEQTSGQEAE